MANGKQKPMKKHHSVSRPLHVAGRFRFFKPLKPRYEKKLQFLVRFCQRVVRQFMSNEWSSFRSNEIRLRKTFPNQSWPIQSSHFCALIMSFLRQTIFGLQQVPFPCRLHVFKGGILGGSSFLPWMRYVPR